MTAAPANPQPSDAPLPMHARALAESLAEDGYRRCPLTDGSDGYAALAPLLAGLIPPASAATRDRAA